jgi:hypothetical protein
MGKTDFSTWDRGTLNRFARDAADENAALRNSVAALQKQVGDAIAILQSAVTDPRSSYPARPERMALAPEQAGAKEKTR